MKKVYALLIFLSFALLLLGGSAEQCGRQAGGAVCPNGLCCSQFGWCGTSDAYCGSGCQSRCRRTNPTPMPKPTPTRGGGDIGRLINREAFNQMLKYSNDPRCPSNGFYNYDAFLSAAQFFSGFATTGDDATHKRELAAFFGQTSHETSGGWPTAPDGPYAWGYCFIRELNRNSYCSPSSQWPCTPGQQYYGRGPIQISYNYNYGQAGGALGLDLLSNPDLVATDAVVAFKTAIWFWMTPQGNKPSCHDVIIGRWQPSNSDRAIGRFSGYGVITNIINGGVECGGRATNAVSSRIGFYKRYCDILGISYGDNLDCNSQSSFA